MPFVKMNAIEEAREVQKIFENDEETKSIFAQYEKEHIDAKIVEEEAKRLMMQLKTIREEKGITQKELEERTGLSQQAISRMEVNTEMIPNFKNIMKYVMGIGCELLPENKNG